MLAFVKLRLTFSTFAYIMCVMFVQRFDPRGRRFTNFVIIMNKSENNDLKLSADCRGANKVAILKGCLLGTTWLLFLSPAAKERYCPRKRRRI